MTGTATSRAGSSRAATAASSSTMWPALRSHGGTSTTPGRPRSPKPAWSAAATRSTSPAASSPARRWRGPEMFQTESEFVLPVGYVDEAGTLHRTGTMRMATAADEILPLRDPRVQQNEAYLIVIILSRVITNLGSVPHINPKVIEGLYAA